MITTLLLMSSVLAQDPAPAAKPILPIYDEAADARQQVADAVTRAAKEERRVLIVWGANWCGSCKQLEHQMKGASAADATDADKRLGKLLMNEFEVVHLDVGHFDKNIDLVRKWRADVSGGIPALTILNGEGKVVANQDNAAVSALTKNNEVGPFADFLDSKKAAPVDAGKRLDAALAQARESGRAVFLHFGAPWCAKCRVLDAWCADPAVAPLLGKDFVEVKIDVDRMTGGNELMKRYRADGADAIPWYAVLDADGKALATSDEPAEKAAAPTELEEVVRFAAVLRNGVKRLTPDELSSLATSFANRGK